MEITRKRKIISITTLFISFIRGCYVTSYGYEFLDSLLVPSSIEIVYPFGSDVITRIIGYCILGGLISVNIAYQLLGTFYRKQSRILMTIFQVLLAPILFFMFWAIMNIIGNNLYDGKTITTIKTPTIIVLAAINILYFYLATVFKKIIIKNA